MSHVLDSGFGEVTIGSALDNQDLWIVGGVQPEPNFLGYTPHIVSSSADDTAAGTGACLLHMHYIDVNGIAKTATVIPNGTTEVVALDSLGNAITDCAFVNIHHASCVGSGLVAAGNIDVLAGSGGSIVSRIPVAGNFSLSTARLIPSGKKVQLKGWHVSATAGTVKQAILRLRSSFLDGEANPGVYHFIDTIRLKDGNSGWLPMPKPILIPSLSIVKISVWTTGALDAHGTWRGVLE